MRVRLKFNQKETEAVEQFCRQLNLPVETFCKQAVFYSIQSAMQRAQLMKQEQLKDVNTYDAEARVDQRDSEEGIQHGVHTPSDVLPDQGDAGDIHTEGSVPF